MTQSVSRSIRQSTIGGMAHESRRQSTNQATTRTMSQSTNVAINEWPTNSEATNDQPT